jgi:hypothetical protein
MATNAAEALTPERKLYLMTNMMNGHALSNEEALEVWQEIDRLLALAREALTQEGRALELERRVKELEREATERGYAYLELRQNAEQERDDFARRCLEHMRLNLSTDGKGGYSLPEADTILAAVKADLAQKEHSHD